MKGSSVKLNDTKAAELAAGGHCRANGSCCQLDEAKAQFRTAWKGFKEKHGPEKLAKGIRGDEPAEDHLAELIIRRMATRPRPTNWGLI